jgi:dihydroorotase
MFGVTGFETAVGLGFTELVQTGLLTPMQWTAAMTVNPARVLGMPLNAADATVIDPNAVYTVDAAEHYSKGKNTPFQGRRLTGRVVYTLINGRVVYAGR